MPQYCTRYNALMAEHHKVRAAHMEILAQGDAMLERKLLRANEDMKRISRSSDLRGKALSFAAAKGIQTE